MNNTIFIKFNTQINSPNDNCHYPKTATLKKQDYINGVLPIMTMTTTTNADDVWRVLD